MFDKGYTPHNGKHIDKSFKNKDTLFDLYVTKGLSGRDIGDMCGADRHTIIKWLKIFDIETRTQKETKKRNGYKKRMSGSNHPNYKDGKRALFSGWGYKMISLYGDERNIHRVDGAGRVGEHIYVMENYINRKLHKSEVVHHINFDRIDNKINNLILFPNQREHNLYHKWLEKAGLRYLGIIDSLEDYIFPNGAVIGTQT
jgi:hypothetical protein